MRLADNLDRHKILDEFEFGPDRTFDFGVTCPLVTKNPIFELVQSMACLVLIETLWNLQITWTGIKSQGVRILARSAHWLWSYLPLSAEKTMFDLVRRIACLVLIGSLWKLQITWTGIKSHTSSNFGKIALFTFGLREDWLCKLSFTLSK